MAGLYHFSYSKGETKSNIRYKTYFIGLVHEDLIVKLFGNITSHSRGGLLAKFSVQNCEFYRISFENCT